MSRDKGGDQAAWRDLVARLELPSTVDPTNAPWPDRENLRSAAPAPEAPAPETPEAEAPEAEAPAPDQPPPSAPAATTPPATPRPATPPPATPPPSAATPQSPAAAIPPPPSRVIKPASPPRTPGSGSKPTWRGASVPGQAPSAEPDDEPPTSPDMLSFLDYLDEDYDDPKDPRNRYVPPPVPPQPRLDPVAKGAWTALFGGPAYLLVATLLSWQVPGWAELAAIAAFVTGFVVLVSRLGDGPSRRDGPDQGAVV